MLEQYNINATWNFFATSHGKGMIDGISETLKWIVWNNILTGRWVSIALEFANVVTENIQNIKVAFVSKEEIN